MSFKLGIVSDLVECWLGLTSEWHIIMLSYTISMIAFAVAVNLCCQVCSLQTKTGVQPPTVLKNHYQKSGGSC